MHHPILNLTPASTAKLNNGIEMPLLGLGTFLAEKGAATYNAVLWALEAGYRLIDTAAIYHNEEDVGAAVAAATASVGIKRSEVFITTKVWNDDQGYDKTLKACEASLSRLKMDYIDLYLIHWPVSRLRGDTWRALIKLYEQGKCRAIGVSNYIVRHLEELLDDTPMVPAVNQVEFNPFLFREGLLSYCHSHGIQLEAYSPLSRARRLDNAWLVKVGAKYGKTPAQVAIRWGLQHGLVVIPKSVHRERIIGNFQVFDFHLAEEDMDMLNNMNEDFSTLPMSWNPETSGLWK